MLTCPGDVVPTLRQAAPSLFRLLDDAQSGTRGCSRTKCSVRAAIRSVCIESHVYITRSLTTSNLS